MKIKQPTNQSASIQYGSLRIFFAFLLCLTWYGSTDARTINEDALRKVEKKVQSIVSKVMPATVGLGSKTRPAGGSGIIVSEDGLILTAAHVVAATGEEIVVHFPDGRRAMARTLGADNDSDAAMVQITDKGKWPYVEFGDSKSLELNDWVIAIGHSEGFKNDRTPPVRLGRLLESNRDGFLTTDCTLIGGDSGGPLFDLSGKVVGIHSNIGSDLTANNHVPMSDFLDNWQRMKDGDTWGRRFGNSGRPNPQGAVLGITPRENPNRRDKSVRVDVLPGSPAAEAGVKSGDTLVKIDDRELSSYGIVRQVMKEKKAGDEVVLEIRRGKATMELTVEVISRTRAMRNIQRELAKKREEERKEKEDNPATEDELDDLLRAHIAQAKQNGGRLELDRDQIRELGGTRRLMRRLRELTTPDELAKMIGANARRDDDHLESIIDVFEHVVDDASDSVIPILSNNEQVALATVIHRDGYLLTKASEVDEGKLSANLDELTEASVKVVKTFPKFDLALLKVDARLDPVDWYTPRNDPPLGAFVAAAGINDKPLAVGVISVAERNLSGSDKGYIGVILGPNILVQGVQEDSPADEAGLKQGDRLTKLDGKSMSELNKFIEAVKAKTPGHIVKLTIIRDGEEQTLDVKLSSREAIPMFDGTGNYPTGGPLSEKRSGYPSALQTDLPIRPQDCGSPVVDLDGRVLGINIARAGRTKTYAIPAETIKELLSDVEFE